jgi:hypothetical protein
MKINHDLDAQKAFHYPLEKSSISSLPPAHKLNKDLNILNNNHNNIIELAEGKTTKVKQSGGRWKQRGRGKTTNGGLNSGESCSGTHCSIPIEPTTDNLIHNNLLSANPPPNANVHYPGSPRIGNSNMLMPGITGYQGTRINPGPFNLKGAGKNTYNYIVNPLTNRKVGITTTLGKKILHNYLGMV